MEAAKAAVAGFLGRSGGQKTIVEENIAPAVTREAIKPHRHEVQTQAIDRELHEHRYHTTVVPLSHQERLPEKHIHNPRPVEHREYHQEDPRIGRDTHAKNLANFTPSTVTHDTRHTATNVPTVTGERVVHHVHEKVQPVVYKDVYQPEIVHTVQPIHETHYAPSEHYGISLLPGRSVDQLKAQGIDLLRGSGGVAHQKQEYEGDPRSYNPKYQLTRNPVDIEPHKHHGLHDLQTTNHPYESKFESPLASPVKTARGYSTGPSQTMGADSVRTSPGRSAQGYKIEPVMTGGAGMPPISTYDTSPRDPADAQRVRTGESLDPRNHWSPNGADAGRNADYPDPVTPTGKGIPRERPDSGISIPSRYSSRGKPSMDESVSHSMTTSTTTTTTVPSRGPVTTRTTVQ